MPRALPIGAVAVVVGALSAQCVLPTGLTTNEPFVYTHYMGTPTPPSPYPGFCHLFDANVLGDANITQIDILLYDDGAVNPSQLGNTAAVEVWITPTTWVGSELNQAAWTQIATGTVTVAAAPAHSPIVFGSGFALPPGPWGVAVLVQGTTSPQPNFGPLHPLYRIPCVSPNNPTGCTANVTMSVRDQFLELGNLGVQRYAWQSGGVLRATNLQFFYTPAPDSAFRTEYGTGCYRLPQSFYEWLRLPPGGSDFQAVGIQLQPVGNTHYNVGPGNATFAAVNSAPLQNAAGTAQMGLNETSAALTLPFTFRYPGDSVTGSASQIVVAANGFVWLGGADGGGVSFGNNISSFLNGLPRIAAFWGALDPSPATGSGSVHFDQDPAGQFVTVTWQGVQEWTGATGGPPLTFQLALFANHSVELRYLTTQASRAPALVGFTPGGGDLDPGSRDLVVGGAVPTFQSPDGSRPLLLTAGNRPVIGATFDIRTESIRAGVAAGLLAVGLQGIPAGTSLAPFGLPPIGTSVCNQYVALPLSSLFFVVGGAQASVPFPIPNNAMFNGVELKYQSLVLSPGLNPAGLLASNGLCVHAGLR